MFINKKILNKKNYFRESKLNFDKLYLYFQNI